MNSFSFGFSGDDIDVDESDLNNDLSTSQNITASQQGNDDGNIPTPAAPEKHDMKEWLSLLPSQISFNRLPLGAPREEGKPLSLARREVFDIRTQLMAEDSVDGEDNGELIAGLEEGDLKPNFYEGGFKTWECALDLARLVVGGENSEISSPAVQNDSEDFHVIELGAGTAIPSLALFAKLLSQPSSQSTTEEQHHRNRRTHFTFADYNTSVLRLVTLPNLLLTWNHVTSSQNAPATSDPPEDHQDSSSQHQEDELEITPELVESFEHDLRQRGITIDFISGAWSPAFVDLVFSSTGEGTHRTLVLASETIYSPLSLGAFSETLVALLRRSSTKRSTSRALVAAKKVYFGVGGGVDEFLAVLKDISRDGLDVRQISDVKKGGVGRLILDIAEAGK